MIKTQAIADFTPDEKLTIWDVRDTDSYQAGRACELLESLDPSRTYVHLTGGTRGAKALGWTLIEN